MCATIDTSVIVRNQTVYIYIYIYVCTIDVSKNEKEKKIQLHSEFVTNLFPVQGRTYCLKWLKIYNTYVNRYIHLNYNHVSRLCFLWLSEIMHCLISNRINIILAVSPRIWRPTLNYTNDIPCFCIQWICTKTQSLKHTFRRMCNEYSSQSVSRQ